MERKNFAVLCAAVLCFWLFALALGTAEGVGLRAVMHPEERAVSADVEESAEGILLPAAAAAPQLDLNCRAAILIEQGSGRVLYEKNADERVPIASITKVMTLLLAFEAVHDGRLTMETPVPVSEHAYHMGGSQIWLEPGEQMTLDDMLKAICISSANDAAVAVAEYVGGSETAFAEMMNVRAYELGMTNTHFVNACGLDEAGHLSTARDVALMSREMLLHHTEVRDYCSIWMDTLRGGATQLVNTNKLLKSYRGITGLKTGTTGTAATVPLNYESPGHCLMPKGEGGTLEAVVELPASLSAPVAAGEQVGRIKILHQGTEMCSYPITAAQNVDALSFRYCLHLLAQSLLLRN